jgi:hypothetical protein
VSLLAIALIQSPDQELMERYREQAHSYRKQGLAGEQQI